MEYTVVRKGKRVTIWDMKYGVGIRFIEGDILQRYSHEVVYVGNFNTPGDEAQLAIINQCDRELTEYAAERWKDEFQELKSNR